MRRRGSPRASSSPALILEIPSAEVERDRLRDQASLVGLSAARPRRGGRPRRAPSRLPAEVGGGARGLRRRARRSRPGGAAPCRVGASGLDLRLRFGVRYLRSPPALSALPSSARGDARRRGLRRAAADRRRRRRARAPAASTSRPTSRPTRPRPRGHARDGSTASRCCGYFDAKALHADSAAARTTRRARRASSFRAARSRRRRSRTSPAACAATSSSRAPRS